MALSGENGPEWVAAFFGIVSLGAIAVPLDPQLAPPELQRVLAHTRARGLIASDWILARAASGEMPAMALSLAAVGALDPVAAASGPQSLAAAPGAESPPCARTVAGSDEAAAILCTSGTGGAPRGVVLSHGNLLANTAAIAQVLYVKPGDVLGSLLPLNHAYALVCSLMALVSGVPLAFADSLRPDVVSRTLVEARVTLLPAVPLVLDHLARAVQEGIAAQPPIRRWIARRSVQVASWLRDRFGVRPARILCAPILARLGPIRGIVVGGAALRPEPVLALRALGIAIAHGYGLTEASPVVTLTPGNWRPGDGVGLPLPGVAVRIADVDVEGFGEVLVKGPNVMRGYLDDAAATAAVLGDGWLATGDLGCFDARGYLHLSGRKKNVIVLASGKNVYPEELEAHYGASPLLAQICVVAAQDDAGAEIPLGILVPSQAALAEDQDPEALDHLLAQELARLSVGLADHKRLKKFEVQREPLPLTPSHKIRRHLVRSDHLGAGNL